MASQIEGVRIYAIESFKGELHLFFKLQFGDHLQRSFLTLIAQTSKFPATRSFVCKESALTAESRSILSSYDRVSLARYEAGKHLDKEGDIWREKYRAGEISTVCYECHQDLAIYRHKLGFVYFRHLSKSADCPLKYISAEEAEAYRLWVKSKESRPHINLKNLLADKLKDHQGVEQNSVFVDDRFLSDANARRRKPDVYCVYDSNPLAFEIQLSPLPRKIIEERNAFYQNLGVYLMWILESVDEVKSAPLDLDVRTRNVYQKSFALVTSAEGLKFNCLYPCKKLRRGAEIVREYGTTVFCFSELKFDKEVFQVYFFDAPVTDVYEENPFLKMLTKPAPIIDKKAAKVEEKEPELSDDEAGQKAKEVQKRMKHLRKKGATDYTALGGEIKGLTPLTLKKLNEILDLRNLHVDNQPFLVYFIRMLPQKSVPFLEFLLNTPEIDLNVQVIHKNTWTAFRTVVENPLLGKGQQIQLVKGLARRFYRLQQSDKAYLRRRETRERFVIEEIILMKTWLRSPDRSEEALGLIAKNLELILALESIVIGDILIPGIDREDWYKLARHCLESLDTQYWKYFRKAFYAADLTDWLIQNDDDPVLHEKLKKTETHFDFFHDRSPLTELLRGLFPELRF